MRDNRSRPMVLVVEDDLSTRKLYVQMLTAGGFDVVEAHNGLQAGEKVRELLPALIVTDLGIPGIDGFELCRRLQQDSATRHIPVVAITGRFVSPADVARARRDGCHCVLMKPIDATRLIAEIRALLGSRVKAPLSVE
jgi:CheY-like chemotaxis protein